MSVATAESDTVQKSSTADNYSQDDQNKSRDKETASPPSGFDVKTTIRGNYLSPATVGHDQGTVAKASTSMRVSYSKFFAGYAHYWYDWEHPSRLPFGTGANAPWTDLNSMILGIDDNKMIDSTWGYFYGALLNEAYEREMGPLGLGAYGGFIYRSGQTFTARFGATVLYHPIQTLALPVFGLEFKPAGDQGPMAPGFSANLGFPETSVTYRFNPAVALRLGAMMEYSIFRLSDDSRAAPKGYVNDRDFIGGLYLDLTPRKDLKLSAGLTYAFIREMILYDSHEQKITNPNLDPSWGGTLRIQFSF
ncbi:MAG: hypothetical protein HQK55_07370 [Deltaproteobacteria bacterium]|nr:hypothetical protein [Deltaproteobacteria bacterium]